MSAALRHYIRQPALFVLPLLLVAPTVPTASAQASLIIDLGTPSGFTNGSGTYSEAHGVNNAGAVTGEWSPGGFAQHAFLYANGTNSDIGTVPGTVYTVAYALNDSNVVVGEGSSLFATYAFAYVDGTMTNLTTAPNLYAIARAVNNNTSQIVGESTVTGGGIHAVIFLGGGGLTDLGVLPTGDYSTAYGINDSGVIVGYSTVISGSRPNTVTNIYAFITTNGVGSLSQLGPFPGGTYSAAYAINNAGQVAGESDTGGEVHAFLYDGTMHDLGTLGGTNSSATAINSAGDVVGYALTTNEDEHAFLYRGGVMQDLNNLITPGCPFTNLLSADGINDLGQITGSGLTTNGDYHAYLITPGLVLASPTVLANGQFQLTLYGLPGSQCVLQVSSDLTNWTSLGTNTLTTSAFVWTDATAPGNPLRFYRALQLQ